MQNITLEYAKTLYSKPFNALLFEAQTVHRMHFRDEMELCTLLSIKTGSCPEDCRYCPQSAHYNVDIKKEKLMDVELIIPQVVKAKALGAKRFCMGAAWRNPPLKAMPKLIEIIQAVKEQGLETCMTLGMLSKEQAQMLAEAGLDYYNHNLDTSENYYKYIITTRDYQSRLDTLQKVAEAGMKVCCGGILGMGESIEDRLQMLVTLANLKTPPASVPINQLIPVPGTPLGDKLNKIQVKTFDFVRTIAVARILLPTSKIRLSAGRSQMSDEMQSLAFLAGANSIFYGDKLLTATNPSEEHDLALLTELGFEIEQTTDKHYEYINETRAINEACH
nr:biotin synthase BioB [Fastidiosibacter lacustris]